MPGKELHPTLRAQICELHSIGWGYKRIHAKHPEASISTIRYTILKQRVREKYATSPRSGRPKILSTEEEKDLLELASQDPHIKMRELRASIENRVSLDTIRRLLREHNMRKWRQKKQPEITTENAAKRLA